MPAPSLRALAPSCAQPGRCAGAPQAAGQHRQLGGAAPQLDPRRRRRCGRRQRRRTAASSEPPPSAEPSSSSTLPPWTFQIDEHVNSFGYDEFGDLSGDDELLGNSGGGSGSGSGDADGDGDSDSWEQGELAAADASALLSQLDAVHEQLLDLGVSPGLASALAFSHPYEFAGSLSSGSGGNAGSGADASASTVQLAALPAKFDVFCRLTSAEPGWKDVLAEAMLHGEPGALLRLPPADFEAALRFVAAQLPRLSRQRYEELGQPYSLYRFVQLHPGLAAAVLAQHPEPFQQVAEPWLRQQLLWDDVAVADAALTEWLPELCQLDAQHAQRCLDWLLGLGLDQQQAGQLLAGAARLLALGSAELSAQQRRVGELAASWGLGLQAAAALVLSQSSPTYSDAQRTGQLIAVLQDTVGLGEQQLVQFALAGGLAGGACTRNDAALQRATDRIKHLLMVYGSMPEVAAALCQHPQALTMSWQALGGLLAVPQQRQAWRLVEASGNEAFKLGEE